MRFGTWRGVTLAITLATGLFAGRSVEANNPLHHTIPKEVDAIDVNTGEQYFAPPIPYGHLNKQSHLNKGFGLLASPVHGLFGKLHGLGGHGLCNSCGGKGCGHCGGSGLFVGHGDGIGHGGDPGCLGGGCGLGHGKRFTGCGLCGGKGCGVCESAIMPSSQTVLTASPQGSATVDSGCGIKGCGLGRGHKHGAGNSFSFGHGCNHGSDASCGNCGGGGGGLGHGCNHGAGMSCGNCGGGGHGLGNGCKACGGAGCGLCRKVGGILGTGKGLVYGLLHPHAGKIEYFVGPGGPVPITPGYVPYVVTTRSPRDFLAFPPFTP